MADLRIGEGAIRQEMPPRRTGRWITSAAMVLMLVLAIGGLTSLMAVDPPEIPNKGPISPFMDIFLPKPPEIPKRAAAKKVEVPSKEPSFPTKVNDGIKPEPPDQPADDPGEDKPGTVDGDGGKEIKPEPPAPPKPEPPQAPIRVGGVVRPPQKIYDVRPKYPQMAIAARVQGVVIIAATINAEGHVIGAEVLKSIPLLDQAALDAVRQWQFSPTTLNGVAVPVIMTVTVQFTLQ